MKKLLLLSIASLLTLSANAEIWDLTSWSAETIANLKGDGGNWKISQTTPEGETVAIDYRAANLGAVPAIVVANATPVKELNGVTIDLTAKTPADKIRIDFAGSNPGLKFNTKDVTFTVTNCTPGEKIAVTFASNSAATIRGFDSIEGATWDEGATTSTMGDKAIAVATITASDVKFAIDGGIGIFKIETGETVSTSISGIETESTVVSTEYFNIAGQKVANPNGITIRKETLSNGKVNVSKIVK